MTAVQQRGQMTTTSSAPTNAPAPAHAPLRINLFLKCVALVVAVVLIALLTNGAFDVWFSYQEYKGSLIRIQREQAEAAAAKIGQFIHEIEAQVGWTTQLPWPASSLEQRRFDASRLLRLVPAITELSQIDATGHEQLRVSRLAMDLVGSGTDYSHDPKFTEAVAHKVYYGPVYFRRELEPYMTLSLAGTIRKHLLGLINDVLDLSKIEAGQLSLSLADYSIKEVVHDVYGAVESLATSKNLALKVEVPKDLPQSRGDERRLTQVLLNLVGNAIKFTDTGEVGIRTSAADGSFTVAVHDTGPGIAEQDQAKIFEEFQQADPRSRNRKAAPTWDSPLPSGSSRCTAAGSGSTPKLARGRHSRSPCRSTSSSR